MAILGSQEITRQFFMGSRTSLILVSIIATSSSRVNGDNGGGLMFGMVVPMHSSAAELAPVPFPMPLVLC